MRRRLRTLGLALVAASALITATAHAATLGFADWTTVDGSPAVATGTLNGSPISISGTHVFPPPVSVIDGHWTFFSGPDFSPPLAQTDVIQIGASSPAESYTLTFGSPVTDPVIDIGSLGSRLDFPGGTEITKLAGQSGFTVSGSSISGAPTSTLGPDEINDSNGTVQLVGTFTSIPFTALFTTGSEDGVILQVGAAPPQPAPPTTTPSGGAGGTAPPPSPPAVGPLTPVSATVPAGGLAAVTATVPDPHATLNWDVNGDGKTDAQCPGSEPTALFHTPATFTPSGLTTVPISATAIGASGLRSTSTTTLYLAASAPPKSLSVAQRTKLLSSLHDPVVWCVPPPTTTGAPGKIFVRPDGKFFWPLSCLPAAVESSDLRVVGCFKPIKTLSDVPADEQPALRQRITKLYNIDPQAPDADAKVNDELARTDGLVSESHSAVTVNGVTFVPGAGAALVLHEQGHFMLTSASTVYAGGVRLGTPRAFDLDTSGSGRIDLGSFAVVNGGLQALGGLPLVGDMHVFLAGGGGFDAHADVDATVQLPPFLGGLHAGLTGHVGANGKFELDAFQIAAPSLDLGVVSIQDFQLGYANGQWAGQGKVCIPAAGCIEALPADGGGITLGPGAAFSIDLDYTPPIPGVPLGTDVYLTTIGANVAQPPLRFGGTASVTVESLLEVDGKLELAFPKTTAPYKLISDFQDPASGFRPQDYTQPLTSFTVAASATGSLLVPVVGKVHLGALHFLYVAPSFVDFGASVGFGFLDVIRVDGHVEGTISLTQRRFQLFGEFHACVADIICGGATGVISDNGVGGCVDHLGTSQGGGVVFKPHVSKHLWPFDGCRWSPFADQGITASAARAGVEVVQTRTGEPGRAIELTGADGAPSVRVTTADGKTLESTPGPGIALDTKSGPPNIVIMRSESLKMTTIGIVDPKTGKNVIELLPGSPAITQIREASNQPGARITARVLGNGARRRVVYDIRKRVQQRVTFYEQAGGAMRQIGVATGGRGQIAFNPAPGRGAHTIIAAFELAGLPAEHMTVARFTPPSPTLPRPHAATAHHLGSILHVTWTQVPGATGYEVLVTEASGPERMFRTTRDRLTVRSVVRYTAGHVTIRAIAPQRAGATITAGFDATGKRPAGRFRELRRRP